MKCFALACCYGSLALTASIAAQTPTFVKDITTGAPASSSGPGAFCISGDKLFMIAGTPANQVELWLTDGTAGGTHIVVDGSPGTDTFISNGSERIAWNGGLLFAGRDLLRGEELWISDGTATGTHLLKDINPVDTNSSSPRRFMIAGGQVIFVAGSPTTGLEWWTTNGTASGTVILKDIVPGSGAPDIDVTDVAEANGLVFFAATDQNNDRELWVTDGTTTGTHRVKDIATSGSSFPITIRRWGNRVVFVATTPAQGRELWVSDGTDTGTTLLVDVTPGPDWTTFSGEIAATATRVYFSFFPESGSRQLWWTDGTAGGTEMIGDGGGQPLVRNPRSMWSDGSRVFLLGGTSTFKVWTADGTVGGTIPVGDYSGGQEPKFRSFETRTIFQNRTPATGLELWISDGTASGTHIIGDLTPGAADGVPNDWCPLGGGLALAGMAGNRPDVELWTIDCVTGAATLVADLSRNTGDTFSQENGSLGDNLLFVTQSGSGSTLWKSDGSELGTVAVKTINAGLMQWLTEMNGKTYFQAPGPNSSELWVTDGSTGGTHVVALDADHRATFEYPVRMGDELFYKGSGPPDALGELWATDGTSSGTRVVVDLATSGTSAVRTLGVVNNKVIFSATVPGFGREAWASDGTPGNGVMLGDIALGNQSGVSILDGMVSRAVTVGGLMYFPASQNGDSSGTALWVTDGTPSGTVKVGTNNVIPSWLVEFQGKAYFARGGELWASDGTSGGTSLVVPNVGAGILELVATPDYLYFITNPSDEPVTLWRSDGTPGGTAVVDTIWPYPFSRPTLAVLPPDGPVYFSGVRPDTGAELYRTNGTAETTLPVEINPGPASSMPRFMKLVGEKFFWFGTDAEHGQELWTIAASELRFNQCPQDFDGDGFVTGQDFDLYVQAFENGDTSADFDGDTFITGVDFDLFVQAFEAGC